MLITECYLHVILLCWALFSRLEMAMNHKSGLTEREVFENNFWYTEGNFFNMKVFLNFILPLKFEKQCKNHR